MKKSRINLKLSKKQLTALKKIIQYVIYIGVAYFIYTKVADEENLNQLKQFTKTGSINYWLLALSVLVFSLHSLFNGLNWHYMLTQSKWDKSKSGKLSLIGQIEVYLKSYLLRYIPGNVVGILSRAIYNKEYKVPMAMSLWGWFLENVTYLAVGVIVGIFVLPFVEATQFVPMWLIIIAAILGLVVILANDWLKNIFNKFLVPKLPADVRDEFVSLDLSLKSRMTLTSRYLISWGIYSLSYILASLAIGIPFSPLLISINALAWSVGYLSLVTPSGGFVREGTMIYLLTGALGIDGAVAVVLSIVARMVFIAGELLALALFYGYKLILKLRKDE